MNTTTENESLTAQLKRCREERDELVQERDILKKKLRESEDKVASLQTKLEQSNAPDESLEEHYTVLHPLVQSKLHLARDVIRRSNGRFTPTDGNQSNSPSWCINLKVGDKWTSKRVSLTPLVLIDSGRRPTKPGLTASHLCHDPMCLLAEHLVWETQAINTVRTGCKKANKCKCGREQKCIFGAHDAVQK